MNEQLAVDLPRAPVLSLEDELAAVFTGEREPSLRPGKFRSILERRRDEVTVSRVLNMGVSVAAQWCIWWLQGRVIESLGRDEDPMGQPFHSFELRSLVREAACPKCEHKWSGTEREPCPQCGCAAEAVVRGAVKPLAYKVAPFPGNAKQLRSRQARGEGLSIVKSAALDQDGVFHVGLRDALIILRRYGRGVREQEWKLRAGQATGPADKPKAWPIGDKCIVVEVAHEHLIAQARATTLTEA